MSGRPMPWLGTPQTCEYCGEVFGSASAYKRHRKSVRQMETYGPLTWASSKWERHCMTPDEMRAHGMRLCKAGWRISGAQPWEE